MGVIHRVFLVGVFLLLLEFQGSFTEAGGKTCSVIRTEKKHHIGNASTGGETGYGKDWCDKQGIVRTKGVRNCTSGEMVGVDSNEHGPLKYFLTLFVIIGYGAVVRTILKSSGLQIPYTVILMLSGLAFGFLSRNFCDYLHEYTAIARAPPKVILFIFLPILIFESAFSIPVHTFMRSLTQILVTAFPGMIISTFATAGIAMLFLTKYEWDLKTAGLFGSIISATDPVAVVAILRELGTSEMLSVNIEGESLLNDGVAILLYEVFERIMLCEIDTETAGVWSVIGSIIIMFLQIAIGGPIFGWFMAKTAIFCLSRIFNDAVVEITLTLVAAYLTYFIGEKILHVSGVMAVVCLGLTMSSERTCISPEVESSVHHFWEMLGYLANTVLFVFVGIIIAETAFSSADWTDLYYLGFLYMGLNLIRFLMLLILSPILARIGYGLKWENMMIMMWGALRGAVGLCLALEVYSGELCTSYGSIGPKFLVQTAGIVILTLCLNGTTTETLLRILRLTEISSGRLQDMRNAVKQLHHSKMKAAAMLKHDRFLADANWKIVDKYTTITDPYIKKNVKPVVETVPSILSIRASGKDHTTECNVCHNLMKNEPTEKEFIEMTEEARLRVIRALKVSFWHQFEHGVLTEVAVQLLVGVAETVEDVEFAMVHAKDLRKFWQIRGFQRAMKTIFVRKLTISKDKTPEPSVKCLRPCWKLVNKNWFNWLILVIILANMIPVIMELVSQSEDRNDAYFYTNIVFTTIYLAEFILKLLALRHHYFKSVWNYIDLFVLLISFAEIGIRIASRSQHGNETIQKVFTGLRLARVLRVTRLPKYLIPAIRHYVLIQINAQLFLGYDIGLGFINAIIDVLKFLPQMVDHPKILEKLRTSLENERLATVREMGLLQKDHPGIVIAVKTRHASRAILNQMRQALIELKEDGLVDEKENELLNIMIEENMKRLWTSPASIPPSDPVLLLGNVPWIIGDNALLKFMKENALLRNFNYGEQIAEIGDAPDGIYIVVSGMVKIHFLPRAQYIAEMTDLGRLPNVEIFSDMTFESEMNDFLTTGAVIGELGVLTGANKSYSATCETSVNAYFVSMDVINRAMTTFVDAFSSLESRMWRAVGMKIGRHLLPVHPFHQAWHLDKIRNHLEKSTVPIGGKYTELKFPSYIADVILLQGKVKNYYNNEYFTAPCLLPRSCVQVMKVPENPLPPILMYVALDDMNDLTEITDSQTSLYDRIMMDTMKGTGHSKTLSTLPIGPNRDHRRTLTGNFGVRGVTAVFSDQKAPQAKSKKPSSDGPFSLPRDDRSGRSNKKPKDESSRPKAGPSSN